jgi:hypothetical protein
MIQTRIAQICHDLNALRCAITAEYCNPGGDRATEYITETKTLIEVAFDVLRREDRWAKKEVARCAPSRMLN